MLKAKVKMGVSGKSKIGMRAPNNPGKNVKPPKAKKPVIRNSTI